MADALKDAGLTLVFAWIATILFSAAGILCVMIVIVVLWKMLRMLGEDG